jgi:hypothetical protein
MPAGDYRDTERDVSTQAGEIPRELLDDAQLLLAYAAQHGLLTDERAVTVISEVRQQSGKTSSSEREASFLKAVSDLAVRIRPATLAGIKKAQSGNGAPEVESSKRGRQRRDAPDGAISRYRRWAIGVLLFLGITQMYALVGAELVLTIESTRRQPSAPRGEAAAPLAQLVQFSGSIDAGDVIRLKTSYAELRKWNLVWQRIALIFVEPVRRFFVALGVFPLIGSADATPPSEIDLPLPGLEAALPRPGEADPVCTEEPSPSGTLQPARSSLGVSWEVSQVESLTDLLSAKFALTAFQVYILPFLYGLLGTCVFILRGLASDIGTKSFESDVAYKLRMPLGALAGVAIAWVVTPSTTPDAIRSLPPAGLAFLAGYSVEVLFSSLDRFVAAFSIVPKPGGVPT